MEAPEFIEFPKIPRLSREIIITEKIDGTPTCIHVADNGEIFVGSRTKWITVNDDHFGFAAWVEKNKRQLLQFGPGLYRGEFWGSKIQRGYDCPKGERHWSLFDAERWCQPGQELQKRYTLDPRVEVWQEYPPVCCEIVPVLYHGPFLTTMVDLAIETLRKEGSRAAPRYRNPEGVVVYHVAGGISFKKTLMDDDRPKSWIGRSM